MFIDRAVDAYDRPHDRRCGACTLCLGACPTEAFPVAGRGRRAPLHRLPVDREPRRRPRGAAPGVPRARLRVRRLPGGLPLEPRASCPRATRASRRGRWRRWRPRRSPRSRPDDFERLAAGMALARAQYDGLRRNALYAIGAAPARADAPRAPSSSASPTTRRPWSPTPPAGRWRDCARLRTARRCPERSTSVSRCTGARAL